MPVVVKRRDPEMQQYHPVPIWWHNKGDSMRVEELDLNNPTLVIKGGAELVVKKAPDWSPNRKYWFVEWKVGTMWGGVNGRSQFTMEDIMSAFGLSEESNKYSSWLIDRFGADVAAQGRYIRWKEFLNIPCPGTGMDGDPNVSVRLTKEMKKAVSQLLGS